MEDLNKTKTALVVFGTRPEAIKMAPVVQAFKHSKHIKAVTCATAQHRSLLDQVLKFFEIKPDFDLNLMQANQDLFHVTSGVLAKFRVVAETVKPDVVLVQGDTTTTFAAALASFYLKIPVGHIEAGLRTWDHYSPYPEEANRRMVSGVTDFHFAPTAWSAQNILNEGYKPETVYTTGNTSIDALKWAALQDLQNERLENLYRGKKLILLTAHRRENFGAPIENIFETIRAFAADHPEFQIVYPVHPNPNVQRPAQKIFSNLPNVSLIEPLDYPDLVLLMKQAQFVLTDSGGLQEEAPTFGKPVLVLRNTTERPEAVEAGCARLVGHDSHLLRSLMEQLADTDSSLYQSMAKSANPYGDGRAAIRIVQAIEKAFQLPISQIDLESR